MTLSIIIPVYNEEKTLLQLLKNVEEVDIGDIKKEIILVDDGSTDKTRDLLKTVENKHKVIYQPKNQGKGAALRAGFKQATGDIVLVQDADLEYDPKNYLNLMKPILDGEADVVFGSRFLDPNYRHVSKFSHIANKALTWFSNILSGLRVSDMWTCYKLFTKKVIDDIGPRLTGNRFEIEPEIAALVGKKKYRVADVAITFPGILRTIAEGKKVRAKDGIVSLWYMVKFNLLR